VNGFAERIGGSLKRLRYRRPYEFSRGDSLDEQRSRRFQSSTWATAPGPPDRHLRADETSGMTTVHALGESLRCVWKFSRLLEVILKMEDSFVHSRTE